MRELQMKVWGWVKGGEATRRTKESQQVILRSRSFSRANRFLLELTISVFKPLTSPKTQFSLHEGLQSDSPSVRFDRVLSFVVCLPSLLEDTK